MLAPVWASGGLLVGFFGVAVGGTGAPGVLGGAAGGAAVAGGFDSLGGNWVAGGVVVVVVVVVLVRETLTSSWSRMVKVLTF